MKVANRHCQLGSDDSAEPLEQFPFRRTTKLFKTAVGLRKCFLSYIRRRNLATQRFVQLNPRQKLNVLSIAFEQTA